MLTQRHLVASGISAAKYICLLFVLSLTSASHLTHAFRTRSLCVYFVLNDRGTGKHGHCPVCYVVLTLGTSQNHLRKWLKCRFLGPALQTVESIITMYSGKCHKVRAESAGEREKGHLISLWNKLKTISQR